MAPNSSEFCFFVLSFLLSCDYCLNFPDSSFEVFTLKNLAWRSTVAPDTASLDAVWSPMPEQKFPWHALCRTYGRWENWSLQFPSHQPQRDISKYDDWINTCASSCYKACQSLAHWAPSYKRLKVINVIKSKIQVVCPSYSWKQNCGQTQTYVSCQSYFSGFFLCAVCFLLAGSGISWCCFKIVFRTHGIRA